MAWNRWNKSQGGETHMMVTSYCPDYIRSLTLITNEPSLKETILNILEVTDRRKELVICIQSIQPLKRKCDLFTGS